MNKNLSVYLDLVRFLAAVAVVISHITLFAPTGFLWRFRPLGHEAVIVFFVLSGFVIAYSVETKDRDLTSYAISRFARLYSVVLPCLIISPLVYYWTMNINPGVFSSRTAQPSSLQVIIEHAFFLNQAWFGNSIYFANPPMWSLSNEFWYYAIFGAAFFLRGWVRAGAVALCGLIAGPKILLLMPVWLIGAVAYRIVQRNMPAKSGATILIVSLMALFAYFRFQVDVPLNKLSFALIGPQHLVDFHASRFFIADYFLGLIIAANFIGVAGISGFFHFGPATPLIRRLASFTFSIYLFHFPLLYLSDATLPNDIDPNLRTAALIFTTIGGSCILGLFTEHKKHLYVNALKAARSRWLPAPKPTSETT